MTTTMIDESPLTEGEAAILKRLEKKPIEVRWGIRGWVPEGLPKKARRCDFDSLLSRKADLVKIELGRMIACKNALTDQ